MRKLLPDKHNKLILLFTVSAFLFCFSACSRTGGTPNEERNRMRGREAAAGSAMEVDSLTQLGFKLVKAEKYDEAMEKFNRALKIDSANVPALRERAALYKKIHKPDEALADYLHIEKLGKADSLIFRQLGNLYYNGGEFEKSAAYFTKALESPTLKEERYYAKDKNLASLYYERACVYAEMEEKEKALADFNKTLKLDPERVRVYSDVAFVYFMAGDKENTAKWAKEFLEKVPEPKTAEELSDVGTMYGFTGRYDEAMKYMNQAVKKAPDSKFAILDRGEVYFLKGDYAKAKADFEKALKMEPLEDEKPKIESYLKKIGSKI